MSRRSNRRVDAGRGKRGKGKAGGAKWAMRIMSVLALAVILAGFGLYSWVLSYLRSDEFRVFISSTVGEVIGSEAEFQLFEWQGLDASSDGFHAVSSGFMRNMQADGLQARLSLAGVRRGVWEISDLRVSKLNVELATEGSRPMDAQSKKPFSKDGFLSGLLPDKAELLSAEVMSMNLDLKTSKGGLVATDMAMRVDGGSFPGSYDLNLSGGTIETPWFGSPLDLMSARGKFKKERLYITESRSKVYDRGLLTFNGEVEGRNFGFFGTLKDVRCEELVPADWRKRLTGNLEAQFKIRSSSDGAVTKGEVELKDGVLTSLPVLDRIAAYANSRRFRRLHLSEARLDYWHKGDRLDLTKIVLASEGLVRLEGSLSIEDGKLNGRFRVGVMPGTLSHIPGAETKVFVRGEKGLLWSPLRITGTTDAPKEDLSDRMIAAAGERMFEMIPETGLLALKFARDTATKLPEKALETGADVIEDGTDILQDGVRGVFDLIPGGGR